MIQKMPPATTAGHAQFDDIPARARSLPAGRQDHHHDGFAMGLIQARARERFLADEGACLVESPMSEEARRLVMAHGDTAMMDCDGTIDSRRGGPGASQDR